MNWENYYFFTWFQRE